MASIGSLTGFQVFRGYIPTGARVVQTATRPGVDGHGYSREARRARQARLATTEGAATAAAAHALCDDYRAVAGTLVTVVDDRGQSTTDVMVLAVSCRVQAIQTPVGLTAGDTYVVHATWTVQYAGAPA